eukprot:7447046-Lingulodinium_polyedra.AAC.1
MSTARPRVPLGAGHNGMVPAALRRARVRSIQAMLSGVAAGQLESFAGQVDIRSVIDAVFDEIRSAL